MGKIKAVINRLYSDYLMPSRLNEYEEIIQMALEFGYEHITFKDYYQKLITNTLEDKKYFLHRHDIDTDIKTTKKIFEIERKYGVKTTYYFRLSTLDIELMREIDNFGSEASYHFEEIAAYCKTHHIKSKDEAFDNIGKVKELFSNNIQMIEHKSGIKIKTIASHGDFVNRKLQLINNEITKDLELKEKLGIICEAYDKNLMNSFDIYVSDKPYPVFYTPENIFKVLGKHNTICMLSHPRQWNTNILVNTFDNLKRFYEGLRWQK